MRLRRGRGFTKNCKACIPCVPCERFSAAWKATDTVDVVFFRVYFQIFSAKKGLFRVLKMLSQEHWLADFDIFSQGNPRKPLWSRVSVEFSETFTQVRLLWSPWIFAKTLTISRISYYPKKSKSKEICGSCEMAFASLSPQKKTFARSRW